MAFATQFVVRQMPVPDQVQLDQQLRSISRLLGGEGAVRPEERICTGSPVSIVEGVYAGITGRVLTPAPDDELRVYVEISLLGRGVSVAVERWMIKTLEPRTISN